MTKKAICRQHGADIHTMLEAAKAAGRHVLNEYESRLICSAYGLAIAAEEIAETADHAQWIASVMGYPVLMKAVSPHIGDPREAGGVMVGVRGPNTVIRAFNRIIANVRKFNPYADVTGIQVKQMLRDGQAFTLEAVRSGSKGIGIALGISNGFSGSLESSFVRREAPITRNIALSMIREIQDLRMQEGSAGKGMKGNSDLINLITATGRILNDFPGISKIGISPVFATKDKAIVSEVEITVASSSERHAAPSPKFEYAAA